VKASPAFGRSLLLVTFACTALAIAAGCGGGGGSSSSGGGGGGGTVPTVTPTPTPTPVASSAPETMSIAISPGATPGVTFSPLPLPSVGTSTIGVGAPPGNTTTTLTLTAQASLPTGVAAPSSIARVPQSIGAQNLTALAYISATTVLQTVSQKSPTFSISFTNALASSYDYIYAAQYSPTTGWSTISTGVVASGNKSATFPAFTEPLTLNANKTWFLIFTAQNQLSSPTPAPNPTSVATAAPSSAPVGATPAPIPDALQILPNGFYGEEIASGLPAPRQLVALPNGDLLAGTDDTSGTVWIIPNAEAAGEGAIGTPHVFLTVPNVSTEQPSQGLAFDPTTSMLYVASNQTVWQVHYTTGDTTEPTSALTSIAQVRRGSVSPTTDGDIHFTTSVAVVPGQTLYVGVGSSCNACVETDPTRGTIQQVNLSTKAQSTKAYRFRNSLAMAVNPATNTMWAGGAGQDDLLTLSGSIVVGSPTETASGYGHPYEFFDPVTLHSEGKPDYGWPVCEENNHLYNPLGFTNANCNSTAPGVPTGTLDVEPRVELWAYSTIIGATFYPTTAPTGCTTSYQFPSAYRGDAFLSMHGSWHENPSGIPLAAPQVIYVPMTGDTPTTAANYTNSGVQWQTLLYGFQDPTTGTRIGRPVGLAVGKCGSLFVSDDFAHVIYRIRPGTAPASIHRRAR
jgi:glucose/arabinose dehydrogenase